MRNLALILMYEGTRYHGWQVQKTEITVAQTLEEAAEQVVGHPVHMTGCGRTDAGVHAYGNVAVFDTESTIPGDRFTFALNRFLPDSIVIQDSWEVSVDFHPRHCDTRKTYEYRILNTAVPLPQKRNFTWHVAGSIDIEKMKEAAAYIVGEHDFKSFCCVRTQAESTVRTIYSLEVLQEGSEIIIRIKGNGFLYNMVRIITGTLIQVGKGRFKPEYVKQMLEAKDRTVAGQTAPPQGLTLVGIEYVDNDDARVV